jgi:PAS domain S-box-containing protein
MSKKIIKEKLFQENREGIVMPVMEPGVIYPAIDPLPGNDNKKVKRSAEEKTMAGSRQLKIDIKKNKIVAGAKKIAREIPAAAPVENEEWLQYIAKASYDVMWDWDIASGNIFVSDSIREVFGYKVLNHTVQFRDFSRCLLQQDKERVEEKLFTTLASVSNTWKDTYLLKRDDGSVASVASRATIIRSGEGVAIRLIGAIQDISRQEPGIDNAGSWEENQKYLLAARLNFDLVWDWDILTGKVFIGSGYEELFGFSIDNNYGSMSEWMNHIYKDDKKAIEEGIHGAINSSEFQWQEGYRFVRKEGSIGKIFNKASIFRNAEGKAFRMLGVIQDISLQGNTVMNGPKAEKDKKKLLAGKISNCIIETIHYSDVQLQVNFSVHLSKELGYDYTYLANLFAEINKISIQHFIILQKIERAKELITANKYTLTEIAWRLHYSSVSHLSNQFKKITGITPTLFKLHQG